MAASPSMCAGGTATARAAGALGLVVILAIQLMVVLDTTIVNVALPAIQHDLAFSTAGLSWVLHAYTLAFGGLLLLGARSGDIFGLRPVLLIGIGLFTVASLLGGLAVNAELLLVARAAQGLGAALAAPQALALLALMFPEGPARARALGLYAAVSIGAGTLGLLLGGVLTQYMTWRWVFFVNVPVGLVMLVLSPHALVHTERRRGSFDLAGAIVGTLGMTGLVYGLVNAATNGWGQIETLGPVVASGALLVGFVFVESRAAQPITPLRLFADRSRAAAYLGRLLLTGAFAGVFYFMTLFLQRIMHLSPVATGLAYVPLTASVFVASRLSSRIWVARFGTRRVMIAGFALIAVALAMFGRIGSDTGYPYLLVGLLVLGVGNGAAFVPLTTIALQGVAPADSGAGSGLVNVMQQIGSTLGLAVLVTVYGRAAGAGDEPSVVAHGFAATFVASAVFMVVSALAAAVLVRDPNPEPNVGQAQRAPQRFDHGAAPESRDHTPESAAERSEKTSG